MRNWIALTLSFAFVGTAPAHAEAILLTNKIACNSIQDVKDLMSMAGKGDEGLPLIIAKLRQNECRQWFAGARILIEKRSDITNANSNQSEHIFCARRTDGDDARCFWTFPGGVQE